MKDENYTNPFDRSIEKGLSNVLVVVGVFLSFLIGFALVALKVYYSGHMW